MKAIEEISKLLSETIVKNLSLVPRDKKLSEVKERFHLELAKIKREVTSGEIDFFQIVQQLQKFDEFIMEINSFLFTAITEPQAYDDNHFKECYNLISSIGCAKINCQLLMSCNDQALSEIERKNLVISGIVNLKILATIADNFPTSEASKNIVEIIKASIQPLTFSLYKKGNEPQALTMLEDCWEILRGKEAIEKQEFASLEINKLVVLANIADEIASMCKISDASKAIIFLKHARDLYQHLLGRGVDKVNFLTGEFSIKNQVLINIEQRLQDLAPSAESFSPKQVKRIRDKDFTSLIDQEQEAIEILSSFAESALARANKKRVRFADELTQTR